jgi:hypothetical protein
MAWRVVEHAERQWKVTVAAERRGTSQQWSLVFAFRSVGSGSRSLWATYPLSSLSKATLFAQADQLSNDTLTAFLAQHLD